MLPGIFIMNMPGFSDSFFKNADGSHTWPHWWDNAAQTVRDVFFSGKFNSMFSMLFAIGFILQLERLEARSPEQAKSVYLRRIGWLFVFGAIHQTVFWSGDVLHIYALFGVVLMALRRAPEKASNPAWRERLVPIAMAGRMPLTNYLLQTAIATFIFYGWGLGFWSRTSPASNFVLAVSVFFLIQIPFSGWWLRRFPMGPMEYVWRRLAYGRGLKLKG